MGFGLSLQRRRVRSISTLSGSHISFHLETGNSNTDLVASVIYKSSRHASTAETILILQIADKDDCCCIGRSRQANFAVSAKQHLAGKRRGSITVKVASGEFSLPCAWGLEPRHKDCNVQKTMRLLRNQLTRRKPPPLRLSSSTATTESKASDYKTPFLATYIEPRSCLDVKPIPRMAAHELDLRPRGASSTAAHRASGTESTLLLAKTKRPTLDDILADRSPPPWTFKAFDRYCQHNLCSENLHFVLDAGLYTKVYKEWREEFPEDNEEAAADPRMAQLMGIWKRLMRDYITRNAPKEINLPASVRDQLANIPEAEVPPDSKVLRLSVEKVRELMEESILLSFLNDKLPQTHSDENLNLRVGIQERPSAADLRSRSSGAHLQSSNTPSAASLQAATSGKSSGGGGYHKRSSSNNAPPASIYTPNNGRPMSLFSVKEDKASSAGSTYSDAGGPGSSMSTIMTPPGTPQQRRLSPWSNSGSAPKEVSAWKKLGSKLGLKKKTSGNMRNEPVFEDDE